MPPARSLSVSLATLSRAFASNQTFAHPPSRSARLASGLRQACPIGPALLTLVSPPPPQSRRPSQRQSLSVAAHDCFLQPDVARIAIALATKGNLATPRCLQPARRQGLGGAKSAGFPLVASGAASCRLPFPGAADPKQKCALGERSLSRLSVAAAGGRCDTEPASGLDGSCRLSPRAR